MFMKGLKCYLEEKLKFTLVGIESLPWEQGSDLVRQGTWVWSQAAWSFGILPAAPLWQSAHWCCWSLSRVQLFATPWTAARHASLSFTISQSLLKLMSIWAGDAIQPSHPSLSLSPPAFSLSQHQGLFQWVGSLHQMAKVLAEPSSSLRWDFFSEQG